MNIAWHLFNHIINSHYLLQYCHIFLFFIFTYLYSTIYHCSSCLCCISICQKSEFYFSLSFESPFIIIIYTHILMYIQLHILLSFISLLARSWTVLHHLSFLLSWNAVFFFHRSSRWWNICVYRMWTEKSVTIAMVFWFDLIVLYHQQQRCQSLEHLHKCVRLILESTHCISMK